jgi:hypothetical protein
MRLWSIHPKYLDVRGIVALWRETLLAKKVLLGLTNGYTNHPQLVRFKNLKDPILGINTYLNSIYTESVNRGYMFDSSKIGVIDESIVIDVTTKQLEYEYTHLLNKVRVRDIKKYEELKGITVIECNPIFNIVEGNIEEWEKVIDV